MRNLILLTAILGACLALGGKAMAQGSPSPRMTPAETKRGWYENRRILIEVSTDSAFQPGQKGLRPNAPSTFPFGEHFGNRIGNVVPMRIRIYARLPETEQQHKIAVDFTALKNGRFSIDPMEDPDFILASPEVLPEGEAPGMISHEPVPVTLQMGDKSYLCELWEIRLYVQTFRMPQPINFNMEFSYAAQPLGEGGLDWKRIKTPDYVLSMSKTSDDGSDLSTGNTSLEEQSPPYAFGILILALGSVWVVTPIAYIVLRVARNHFLSHRNMDPEERAWLVLDALFKKCKTENGYKFDESQVRIIVSVVLNYIGKPALDTRQLESLRYADDDGELLIKLLRPLMEGVLERGRIDDISQERFAELVAYTHQLIKRP